MSDNRTWYGEVMWCYEDIQALRPKWSEAKCNEWLEENGKYIQARMCELGWEVIETLLPPK